MPRARVTARLQQPAEAKPPASCPRRTWRSSLHFSAAGADLWAMRGERGHLPLFSRCNARNPRFTSRNYAIKKLSRKTSIHFPTVLKGIPIQTRQMNPSTVVAVFEVETELWIHAEEQSLKPTGEERFMCIYIYAYHAKGPFPTCQLLQAPATTARFYQSELSPLPQPA